MKPPCDTLQARSALHCASSASDASLDLVVKELQHRIRNVLSVVQCLVSNTEAETVADFRSALATRTGNLADAYRLLEGARARPVSLAALLERTLKPHAGRVNERIVTVGPDIILNQHLALTLHVVFHELATNAGKHGSLSVASGSVEVLWNFVPRLVDPTLAIQWRERGGPVVRKPQCKGFGMRLIASALPGSGVDFDFAVRTGLSSAAGNRIDPDFRARQSVGVVRVLRTNTSRLRRRCVSWQEV